jgi:hypothetical protein
MSNLNAIGLLGGLVIAGTFVVVWGASKAREVAADIVTGVVHGVPVPMKYRWLSLYNVWVGYMTAVVLLALILGLVAWQIGANVSDANVRLLAYLCAAYGGTAFIGAFIRSVSQFVFHRALLRESEGPGSG